MKNFFAPVLLGLCLSSVLADLPYHNFEGRDIYNDVPAPPQSTPHYPMRVETGGGHHNHQHHYHSPTGSDPPEETRYNKYELRHESPYQHNPHHTSYPTGGYPSHHRYPPHHHPEGPLETPPYPTNTEFYLGRFAKYEHMYTMKTVTRTGSSSSDFPPYGTGSPYPHPRKL
ncbi:hypothetical protein F4782DRAFT_550131 [Xylaria castorea]|nr:hypothetical protein F4782DRAFT_550131 [Xylaria castorea]